VGVGKRLGGDTAQTTNPNSVKGYSVLYDVMLRNKEKKEGAGTFVVMTFVFLSNCYTC